MIAGLGVFLALFAARSTGFWSRVLTGPPAFDAASLRLAAAFSLWPLLLAAGLWTCAWGLGRRALKALRTGPRRPIDELCAAALGLGLLGQAVFFLGWAGGLRPGALAALAAGAALLAAGEFRRSALPRPAVWDAPAGAAAGLLAFAAAVALLDALAPPIGWDVRAYHLAIPELGLRAGSWTRQAWLIHSHWPHLMETLYALPLAAGRDSAAALLHAGAAALLVAGVFAAGRRAAGPVGGWTAALLLAAQPTFLAEAGTAHADAAAALLAFAAALMLARWDEEGGTGSLAAAGLLAGLAAAAKLTLTAPLAAWTVWLAARRRPADAARFLAAALAALGPWLIKTYLETGDPMWPFLSGPLGGAEDRALNARFLDACRWHFPPPAWLFKEDWPIFLLLPLVGLRLAAGRRRPAMGAEERLLWLAAPALLLLALRQNAAWRYLMPVWPAMALACGRWTASGWKSGGARAAVATALAGFGILPLASATPNNALFAVLGVRPATATAADRRAYWEDLALGGLPGFYREAAAALPPRARVLLWRETRGYGAGFEYLWGDPINQNLLVYRTIPDPEALYARLKALGVTHVLEHPGSALYAPDPGYYDARTLALMEECLRRHGRVRLSRDGFALHELL